MKPENLLPFQKLDIYIAAKELARLVREEHVDVVELGEVAAVERIPFARVERGLRRPGAAEGGRGTEKDGGKD